MSGKDRKGLPRSLEKRERARETAPTMAPRNRGAVPAWSAAGRKRVSYEVDVVLFDGELYADARVVELAPGEVSIRVDPLPDLDTLVTFSLPMLDGGKELQLAGIVVSRRQGASWSDGVSVRLNPLQGGALERYEWMLSSLDPVARPESVDSGYGFELSDEE